MIDEKAPGGFGPCTNLPKKCQNGDYGKNGEAALIVYPDELVDVRGGKAITMRLVNRIDKTASFAACDSTLYIVQEARDKKGQWKALEHFPAVICGNSFHRVFLESNEYWEIHARVSEGRFKTTLRFRLEPEGERRITAVGGAMYSNEYEGSIDADSLVEDPSYSR